MNPNDQLVEAAFNSFLARISSSLSDFPLQQQHKIAFYAGAYFITMFAEIAAENNTTKELLFKLEKLKAEIEGYYP